MPRHTHVPVHHRHSLAHIRFHRDRWVAKRHTQYKRLTPPWAIRQAFLDLPWGRLEDEQVLLGCRRVRCGICHIHDPGRRGRERSQWRDSWEL